MFKLFNRTNQRRLWDFKGGIYPPMMKSETSVIPLRHLPLPEIFIIPLQQHLGPEGELLIQTGDHVLKGQPLTKGTDRILPIHAPTSGTITTIALHTTAHPSGLPELCIHLTPDGQDTWTPLQPKENYRDLTATDLLSLIHQAGIAGLGGAGFPTAVKLQSGQSAINTLIINAAECEPYITADDRLIQEHAAEIVQGCRILAQIIQPKEIVIAIEDNKPLAIEALQHALLLEPKVQLQVIPTKYPSGGAKQLTKILTGKEIPSGQHSASIGVLMQNVGTVFAIKRAIIDGEPLIQRVITLTGTGVTRPGNVWGRIGTPISHLLKQAQSIDSETNMVIMGGPLTGFTVPTLDIPMIKTSNCLFVPAVTEVAPTQAEQPCIRCSQCVDVCPAGLLPQQLFWFSQGAEHEKARQHHLFDCIECGACAYVCPSQIPLVQYYRQQKAIIRAQDKEAQQAQQAKLRFEAKKARLAREKLARQQSHQQAATRTMRHTKNNVQEDNIVEIYHPGKEKSALATGAFPAATLTPAVTPSLQPQGEDKPLNVDPRQAALAAAIARVKAKKAQNSTISVSGSSPSSRDHNALPATTKDLSADRGEA